METRGKAASASTKERCRLCLSESNLMDVFDKVICDSKFLRQFILVTSGVEILETDLATKKVCHRCCIIAVKSYKYRYNAIENDKMLKKKCGQEYVPPSVSPMLGLETAAAAKKPSLETAGTTKKLPTEMSCLPEGSGSSTKTTSVRSDVRIKTEHKSDNENPSDMPPSFGCISNVTSLSDLAVDDQNIQISSTNHKSVNRMLHTIKTIIVPKGVLNDNISPVIVLDRGFTHRYLKSFGKNVEEQKEYCLYKIALMNSEEDVLKKKRLSESAKQTAIRTPGNVVNTNRINFSNPKTIRELLPDNSLLIPAQPKQVSRKRTATQSFLDLYPSKRKRLADTYSNDGSSSAASPAPSPVPSDVSSNTEKNLLSADPLLSETSKTEIFECQICQKMFDKKKHMQHHMKVHLRCKLCKEKFKTTELWEEHLKSSCFITIAKNLPSIKLTKVDEIESLKALYPDLQQSNLSYAISAAEESEKLSTAKALISLSESSNLASKKSDVSSNDNDDLTLKGMLESSEAPVVSKVNNEGTIEIIDDDQDVPPSKAKKTKESKSKKSKMESVSVIHPDIDLKLVDYKTTILSEVDIDVTGKSDSALIVPLFAKYSSLICKDANVKTDGLPDSNNIQYLGTMISLQNMAPELNYWKIPVLLKKSTKLQAQYVPHDMPPRKKNRNPMNWSHMKAEDIVKPQKQPPAKAVSGIAVLPNSLSSNSILSNSIPSNSILPPSSIAPQNSMPPTSMPILSPARSIAPAISNNQTLTMPVLTQTALVATTPATIPTAMPLSSDLLAIPTSSLYQTGPTTYTIATNQTNPSIMIHHPPMYGQHYVVNSSDSAQTVNMQQNGVQNSLILTSSPSAGALNKSMPMISFDSTNRNVLTPLVSSEQNNIPKQNNNTPPPPNNKYLRVRTNLT